jgi:protein-disulfide isomerase
VSCYRAWIAASLLLLSACGKSSAKSEASKADPTLAPITGTSPAEPCGVGLDIGPAEPVATVNGKAIPCSELFALTSSLALVSEAEFREGVRGIHKQGLANLIDERLLQAAADEKKQSLSEFVATTLTIQPTTPEEAKAFYEQAVAQGETLPPFEEITGDLVGFLNERKQKTELATFRDSLRAAAKINTSLPLVVPPKFTVDATGPSQGSDAAMVTIVEFSDYQCGFCGKAEPTVHKLLEEYGDKVRLVYRDYPLPNHTDAPKASEAAHCAGKENKFWEMHDLLFQNQRTLGIDALKGYAQTIGLNSEEFASCLDSGEMKPVVVASLEAGEKVGVNGTPAFFVNGRLLSGAQSLERFKEVVDYELSQLKGN